MSRWTSDEDALLRKLWDQGLTGEKIGRQLGRPRSGVLARARRLKLDARPIGGVRPREPYKNKPQSPRPRKPDTQSAPPVEGVPACVKQQAPAARPRPKQNGRFGFDLSRPEMRTPRDEPDLPAAPTDGEVVTLMGLQAGMCKFPMNGPDGGTVFCGDKARPGTSWCDTHRAVVFQPVPPRKLNMRKV